MLRCVESLLYNDIYLFCCISQVGSTDGRDCSLDFSADPDQCNLQTTPQGRSWTSPSGGSVGVAFGQFMGGSNKAPIKPFAGLNSYNSNDGLTLIQD